MTEHTALDAAHAIMQGSPDDDAARLRFYAALADSEVFLLLEEEAVGDDLTPQIFDLPDIRCVLVFDSEERLTQFTGSTSPYAAMPARALCTMLAGQEIGLGVNLEVAPSSMLLPAEAVAWLAEMLEDAPDQMEARPETFSAPRGLPEALLMELDRKLAMTGGLAHAAYLVGVGYETGEQSHMLAFVDAIPDAEPALARAVSEALSFSGIEAGMLDVSFVASTDSAAAQLARHGLRFDLPELEKPEQHVRAAPGSNPEKPPILK